MARPTTLATGCTERSSERSTESACVQLLEPFPSFSARENRDHHAPPLTQQPSCLSTSPPPTATQPPLWLSHTVAPGFVPPSLTTPSPLLSAPLICSQCRSEFHNFALSPLPPHATPCHPSNPTRKQLTHICSPVPQLSCLPDFSLPTVETSNVLLQSGSKPCALP